jgi:hypothetical protein
MILQGAGLTPESLYTCSLELPSGRGMTVGRVFWSRARPEDGLSTMRLSY